MTKLLSPEKYNYGVPVIGALFVQFPFSFHCFIPYSNPVVTDTLQGVRIGWFGGC